MARRSGNKVFFLHGSGSHLFLESNLGLIHYRSPVLAAIALIAIGLILLAPSMSAPGWEVSVGQDVSALHVTGFDKLSRNSQLVACLFVLVGSNLFWPSWRGLLWLVLAYTMARSEEIHLMRQYQGDYGMYRLCTPGYIGWPMCPGSK